MVNYYADIQQYNNQKRSKSPKENIQRIMIEVNRAEERESCKNNFLVKFLIGPH